MNADIQMSLQPISAINYDFISTKPEWVQIYASSLHETLNPMILSTSIFAVFLFNCLAILDNMEHSHWYKIQTNSGAVQTRTFSHWSLL